MERSTTMQSVWTKESLPALNRSSLTVTIQTRGQFVMMQKCYLSDLCVTEHTKLSIIILRSHLVLQQLCWKGSKAKLWQGTVINFIKCQLYCTPTKKQRSISIINRPVLSYTVFCYDKRIQLLLFYSLHKHHTILDVMCSTVEITKYFSAKQKCINLEQVHKITCNKWAV